MRNDSKPTVFGRWTQFFRKKLWQIDVRELPWPQRAGVQALRLAGLVVHGFRRDQCPLHAASLTFFSMMALVPVLVLALAMARTFGGADLAKAQLDKQLNSWMAQMEQSVQSRVAADQATDKQAQAEVAQAFSTQVREISDRLYEQVNRISFATLGGIGLVMLLWTVVGVLGKVESSFNQVWGVSRSRPLLQKSAYYLFMIMVLPFLSTAASTVPVARMVIEAMDRTVGGPTAETLRALLDSGLFRTGVTLTLGTLTFAFLLGVMPNTRVKTVPALVGGFVTLVLFNGWLKLCAMLQVGIAKYSALYGGFAVLPILLMWVYTSWEIILLGSEIAFAVQNRDTYMLEQHASAASLRARLLLALTVCAETSRASRAADGGPFAAEAFARAKGIPGRFLRDILDGLVRNGILAEVADRPGEFLLCRSGECLSVAEVARALIDEGEPIEALGLRQLDAKVASLGAAFDESLKAALDVPLAQV